jgi:hypothetical protein
MLFDMQGVPQPALRDELRLSESEDRVKSSSVVGRTSGRFRCPPLLGCVLGLPRCSSRTKCVADGDDDAEHELPQQRQASATTAIMRYVFSMECLVEEIETVSGSLHARVRGWRSKRPCG